MFKASLNTLVRVLSSLCVKKRKIFVFIINCRVNLLFLLSDFETGTALGSVRFDNYDNS